MAHWQWEAFDADLNDTVFMLNTDFEIFFDLDLDANGKSVCKIDQTCVEKKTCGKRNICPQAATYDIGKKYIDVSKSNRRMLGDKVATIYMYWKDSYNNPKIVL